MVFCLPHHKDFIFQILLIFLMYFFYLKRNNESSIVNGFLKILRYFRANSDTTTNTNKMLPLIILFLTFHSINE